MKVDYIFLDMDGVLADFVTGCCVAHNRPNPYIKPKAAGIWNLEQIWGITATEFWAPLNGEDFWLNLAKTPEADILVDWACNRVGAGNVAILTAPSWDGGCITGKRKWVRKYYPHLENNLIYTGAKKFLANDFSLLIDDRNENVWGFRQHGGQSFLLPRPWNDFWNLAEEDLPIIDLVLENAYGKSGR